jgi:hypothetical protein
MIKRLLRSLVLVLLGATACFCQTQYAPNQRLILVNESIRPQDYIEQAQKLLKPAGKLDVRISQNMPSLLLIQDPNVTRLDHPPTTLTHLGRAYPNWFETRRSSLADTSYCVHCLTSETASQVTKTRLVKRRPDPAWQLPTGRKSAMVSMVKCCPTANGTQKQRVTFITVKGTDKLTIAELFEETSRLTAPRTVDVVRFNALFPPQANPLLTTFNQHLAKANQAHLRTTSLMNPK